MRLASSTGKDYVRSELLLLLAASLSCAIVLMVAVTEQAPAMVGGFRLAHLLALVITGGALTTASVMLCRTSMVSRHLRRRRQDEIAELRRSLAAAEAILKAEPQVLVFWQHGRGVKIAVNSLSGIPGLPDDENQLLRFGQWLEPAAACDLKLGLDTLFTSGRSFNLLLRTAAGGQIDAAGRVAGGRAVLRLRDVAGSRRDLARIMDQHRQLARDVTLSRALLNALPMPVWLQGGDGRLSWVNTAYARAVEAADPAEVCERQLDLLEIRQKAEAQTIIGQGSTFARRLALNIAGSRRAHDVVMLPLGDASAAAAIDVTAAESARGELDRQTAAYDRTLDRVATAVAIFGADHRLTFCNMAYQSLWMLDQEWLDARPTDGEILDRLREASRLPEVISRDGTSGTATEAVNYREWKARVLSGYGSEAAHEEGWYLPDGRTLHVTIEMRPDGGITHFYDDVTERLALESRHNALIDVQRETLDHLKEGIAVFGMDGRLRLFNQAFQRVWKLARPMLAENPHIDAIISQCRSLYEDDRDWSQIARAVTEISDQRQPIEGQMTRADQSVIEFAAMPLPDGGTLVSFSDVTASKRYERALIDRNEALVAADRLKSQFISHVSYELRTPMTNIIGFSELLESPRTGALNNKQREYLKDVSVSSKTLLSIIDDILDLATIDAGALELKLSPVKIDHVVETALLGVHDRVSRARLRLEVTIAPDIASFVADEGRVRQVLYNLVSNAIGFSNPGGVVRLDCGRTGAMIAFTVHDQGVGIPKDQQRAVMERFVSRTQGSKHRGAGLGLSIVKSLVELHGGEMMLDSSPGQGTSVTVLFPEFGRHAPNAPLPQVRVGLRL